MATKSIKATKEVTIVIAPAPVLDLEAARGALVSVVGKTGEVIGTYAKALCQAFDLVDNQGAVTTPWYELKGKLAASVKGERAKFSELMAARGHNDGVVGVYWQRVKEASGRVKSTTKVVGSSDIDAKTLADLKTIINRIFKSEEDGMESESSGIKGALMTAFADLGGDIDKLG